MPLVIRDATPADLDALAAVARSPAQHADRLRDADVEHLRYFVAEMGGQIVGFGLLVFAQPPTWPPQRRMPRMIDLYVAESHRRRGIGRAMIGYMEDEARLRGFTELLLSVDPTHNVDAQRLYSRLGYVAVQREPILDRWCYKDSAGTVHQGEGWLLDLRKPL